MNLEIASFFSLKKIRDVMPMDAEHRGVISVNDFDTVEEAFQKLVDHDILSAPVLENSSNTWSGFIDMIDIVNFAINVFGPAHDANEDAVAKIEDQQLFKNSSVRSLQDQWSKNPFITLRQNSSLFDLMRAFADKKVHRVGVTNDDGELLGVISQWKFIEFIHKNIHYFGKAAQKIVGDLKLGYKHVVTVTTNQLAINAFRSMTQHNVLGLAVVDQLGFPVGNISARDLKGISGTADFWPALYLPVDKFLDLVGIKSMRPESNLISCSPYDTLDKVLMLLTTNHIHRLFVVDEQGNLTGVIALYDVIQILLNMIV